jgi:hypothetical protein
MSVLAFPSRSVPPRCMPFLLIGRMALDPHSYVQEYNSIANLPVTCNVRWLGSHIELNNPAEEGFFLVPLSDAVLLYRSVVCSQDPAGAMTSTCSDFTLPLHVIILLDTSQDLKTLVIFPITADPLKARSIRYQLS